MTTWKRHYKLVSPNARMGVYKTQAGNDLISGSNSKHQSVLPEVYSGMQGRTSRYTQYDLMENDPEVSASLDILGDFCTQNNEENDGMPFDINYEANISETAVETVESKLKDWVKLNEFESRIFDIVRSTLKYGDQFFVRDPETMKLLPVDAYNIESVIVDETKGKKPEQYHIKDLQINLQASIATNPIETTSNYTIPGSNSGGTISGSGGVNAGHIGMPNRSGSSSRFALQQQSHAVDAEHVIHLSMNNGLDHNWPFGTSVLENIYKVYKQKELLEDAIIIYRIQRAPERRIFKIDVGDLPHQKAIQFVERMKNEMHQRKIPAKNSGNTFTLMDTAYDPQSMLEDFYFPVTADGRGSDVSTLPSGQNLGEINDLVFFSNKLIRGLKIPSSYLPFGPEEGTASHNDGRPGQVLVQEIRFAKYCQRIQSTIIAQLDKEFKHYLIEKGYSLDPTDFNIKFNKPMNFSDWSYVEMMGTRVGLFTQLNDVSFLSKRMLMDEVLGWNEEKIAKNAKLWKEENPSKLKGLVKTEFDDERFEGAPGLKSVDVGPGVEPSPEDKDFDDELEDKGPDEDAMDLDAPGEI